MLIKMFGTINGQPISQNTNKLQSFRIEDKSIMDDGEKIRSENR